MVVECSGRKTVCLNKEKSEQYDCLVAVSLPWPNYVIRILAPTLFILAAGN